MTREEAIKIMKNYPEWHHFHESEEKAFRMGLQALEAIPKIREELSDLLATDNELFGISDALRVIDKYIPKE
jgi:hypothetical protein